MGIGKLLKNKTPLISLAPSISLHRDFNLRAFLSALHGDFFFPPLNRHLCQKRPTAFAKKSSVYKKSCDVAASAACFHNELLLTGGNGFVVVKDAPVPWGYYLQFASFVANLAASVFQAEPGRVFGGVDRTLLCVPAAFFQGILTNRNIFFYRVMTEG